MRFFLLIGSKGFTPFVCLEPKTKEKTHAAHVFSLTITTHSITSQPESSTQHPAPLQRTYSALMIRGGGRGPHGAVDGDDGGEGGGDGGGGGGTASVPSA